MEDNDNENPKDVYNDKTEVNDKDTYNKIFDQNFNQKGSRTKQRAENKTTNFESLDVDDGKEGGKDVDGNNNVDKELPKWIRIISQSGNEEKTKVF